MARQADVDRPVITIADMDAALKSVTAHGGQVVGAPIPVGDMGVVGYFRDSEGNLLGLWPSRSG